MCLSNKYIYRRHQPRSPLAGQTYQYFICHIEATATRLPLGIYMPNIAAVSNEYYDDEFVATRHTNIRSVAQKHKHQVLVSANRRGSLVALVDMYGLSSILAHFELSTIYIYIYIHIYI